ncbi:vitellogenin-6-like [Glandiceps talaboti]
MGKEKSPNERWKLQQNDELEVWLFKPGKEYVYRYEGQLLTGIPEQFKDSAGIKITANAIFQFQLEENKVLMKLDDIDLFKILEKIDDPKLQLPLEWWSKVTGPEIDGFLTELKKPVRFVYRWGEILDFETDTWEPLPSINIKRGILNMFQITWRQEFITAQHNLSPSLLTPTDPKGFKIIEKGVAGECETIYVVSPKESEDIDSNISMKEKWVMWKTKNLQKCLAEPVWEIQPSTPSETLQEKDSFLKSTSLTKLVVHGNREEFLLESAWSEGQHMPLPWTSMPVDVNTPTTVLPITFVNQSLWLTSAGRPRAIIDVPAVMEKRMSGLKYERSWGEWPTPVTTKVDQWKVDEIETIVTGITDGFRTDSIDTETPVNFMLLIKKLRELNGEEIKKVLTAFAVKSDVATEDQERRWRIILDAVPHIGTEEAMKILFDWIETKWIEGERANQILTTMAFRNPVKQDTVDKLMNLCKSETMISQPWVWSTCWLTFGNWVHKLCITSDMCTDHQRSTYKKILLDGIASGKTFEEQHVFLKALGNAGLPETLDNLVKLARTEEIPMALRAQALFSLRKMAKAFPDKVAVVLVPIIHDTKGHAEIRIPAFLMFLAVNPSQSSFLQLGRMLRHEPNQHVASFVWSTLHSLSQLHHPMWRKQVEHAKLALRLTKQHHTGWHMSRAWMKDWKTDNAEWGSLFNFAMIGHPSLIPRGAAASWSFMWKDKHVDWFEAGFRQEGMSNFFDMLIGRKPITATDKVKKQGKKDLEGIAGIASTLGVKARKPEKPWISFYTKVFGNEWRMFSLDASTITELLTRWGGFEEIERKLSETMTTKFEKSFLVGEGATRVMTEMGIPVTWNFTSTAMISADIDAQMKWDPKWWAEKSFSKIRTIEGTFKSTPKVAMWISGSFGADAHVLHTGLGVEGTTQLAIPIHPTVTLDMTEWKLKWSRLFHDKEFKLVDMKWKPFTWAWWGREELEQEETGWVLKHTPTNKLVKVIQTDQMEKEFDFTSSWPEFMQRESIWTGKCTPMVYPWPKWCGFLNGPMEWTWVTRPTPGWTSTEMQVNMWWTKKSRASLAGQDWRAHEDTCIDRNREVDVWAWQVSKVKSSTPEILWDVEWNMDWRDGKYKSSEMKLTTFRPDTKEPFKFCWQGEFVRPSEFLEDATHTPFNKEITAWWHFQGGRDCQTDIKMDVEVIFNKTDEQVRDETERNTWEDEICEHDQERGRKYSDVCRELALRRGRLNRMNAIFHTEFLPKSWTKYGKMWMNFMKFQFWWNLVWGDRPHWQLPSDKKVVVVGEVDLWLHNSNLTILTPEEMVMFENWYCPMEIPTLSTKLFPWNQFLMKAMDWKVHPSCKIMGDEIRTFDNVTFEHQWSERDYVVAMDCTPDETFAVTVTKKPGFSSKFVTVFLENKKVEILPNDNGNHGFLVKIDDHHKPLMMNERMWIRPNGEVEIEALDSCGREGTRHETVEGIDKWSYWVPSTLFEIRHMRGHVELIAEHLGLVVKSDGNNVKVQGAPFMWGSKLCGLCGNFDQEWWNEFIGPNGLPTKSFKKFAESYHLSDAWCNANRITP